MQSANRKLLVEITYLTEFRKDNLMQENKGWLRLQETRRIPVGCHFPAAKELEVYDSFSVDDLKSTEAGKRNQRRNELCCQG